MQVAGIFDEVAQQMRADLERTRQAVQHPGLKGSAFEEVFRTFLRAYLPQALDIATGVLVDSNGGHSRQLDVIISDAARTPIFYRSGETRVIPVEGAYAVIEVKAYLDGEELARVFQNMQSVRALEKKAYYQRGGALVDTDRLYGLDWEIWPVNYFVFAFDSVDLRTLALAMDDRHRAEQWPPWSRIDTICVLDKGVILNQRPDNQFDALPEPESRLFVCKTQRALLLFYTLIARYLNQARLPPFRFNDYLGQIAF
jgi:hypothetical protein